MDLQPPDLAAGRAHPPSAAERAVTITPSAPNETSVTDAPGSRRSLLGCRRDADAVLLDEPLTFDSQQPSPSRRGRVICVLDNPIGELRRVQTRAQHAIRAEREGGLTPKVERRPLDRPNASTRLHCCQRSWPAHDNQLQDQLGAERLWKIWPSKIPTVVVSMLRTVNPIAGACHSSPTPQQPHQR